MVLAAHQFPRSRMTTTFSPLAPQRMSSTQLQRWLSAEGSCDDAPGACITAALQLLASDRVFYAVPSELDPYLSRVEQHLKEALKALAEAKAAMGE